MAGGDVMTSRSVYMSATPFFPLFVAVPEPLGTLWFVHFTILELGSISFHERVVFASVTKDTEFCIKRRQYQTV